MTYHSQKRKTSLVLCNALNLSGWFRSKCVFNNQFHMGLSAPYLRIFKTTKKTPDAMLQKFKYLKYFLPRGTQKGVFTVIISTPTHNQVLQLWIISKPDFC